MSKPGLLVDPTGRPVCELAVTVYEGIFDRIYRCLERSTIEEGGKFIGRLETGTTRLSSGGERGYRVVHPKGSLAVRQNNLSRESSDDPCSTTAPTPEWTSYFGEPPLERASHRARGYEPTRSADAGADVPRRALTVESFIDSGPKVDNSSVHLIPDGDYQEDVFHHLELDWQCAYLEHLGSWHSHHCNGLPVLSQGDLRGYYETVNDPKHNHDCYLVFLVTRLNWLRQRVSGQFYFFFRGWPYWYELPWDESLIRVVPDRFAHEDLLQKLEQESLASRAREEWRFPSLSKLLSQVWPEGRRGGPEDVEEPRAEAGIGAIGVERLQDLRAADQRWFSCKFPKAKTRMSKPDQRIYWEWLEEVRGVTYRFRYYHPRSELIGAPSQASLEVTRDESRLRQEPILLDEHRHERIMQVFHDVTGHPAS